MNTSNNIKIYVVMSILLTFSFYLLPVSAQNLTTSSAIPYIDFDDTDVVGNQWRLTGDQYVFSLYSYDTNQHLLVFDDTATMQLEMLAATFQIEDEAGNTIVNVHRDAPLSLDIQANGDVSLAGGDVFIDTSLNRLGIGTTTPGVAIDIRATWPAIRFDDSDESGLEWEINANQDTFSLFNFDTNQALLVFDDLATMQLEMLAATFQIEDEASNTIVNVHRNAPLSLDIQANGDVSLAGGDVFIDTSANRVGIGTSVPLSDLDIKSLAPGIHFDDTSVSSADWFVGNEVNDLVFKIQDNATGGPAFTQILTLDAQTGYIGMNKPTPTAPLHVARSDGLARILVEETNGTQGPRDLFEIKNNGNPEFRMSNSGNGNSWLFSAGVRFVVKNNAGIWVSRITSTGDMEITGSLTTTGGTCGGGGCDLVFQPETQIESIEEHAASMWTNRYLPAVGPTLENAPFNLTEKTGGMLNELEKAHIYIEQLNKRLAEQDQRHEASIEQLKLENQVLLTRQQEQYAELKALITLQPQQLVASLE